MHLHLNLLEGEGSSGPTLTAGEVLLQLDFVADLDQPGSVGQARDRPPIPHDQDRRLAEISSWDGDAGGRRQIDPVGSDRTDAELLASHVAKNGQKIPGR